MSLYGAAMSIFALLSSVITINRFCEIWYDLIRYQEAIETLSKEDAPYYKHRDARKTKEAVPGWLANDIFFFLTMLGITFLFINSAING